MKELDLLLERWLADRYPNACPESRAAFERLLEAQDAELAGWLLGRERPADAAVAELVDEMLARPR